MSEEFVKDGTDLAIAEMILSGTTCFNDMYFFPGIAAQQAIEIGMRANLGMVVVDFPTVYAQTSDEYIAKGLALRGQMLDEPLISVAFAPHAPYTVSDAPLQKINQHAGALGLSVNMHVHETLHEVEQAFKDSGKHPLQRLHELGLVNDRFVAVHMTQLTDEEIAAMAAANAYIVHCPESNLKLASGFCPVAQCLAAGINVALGTDGAASNNDLDMLGEMRTAALLAKAVANDASALPAMAALQMATLNGAKALGLDKEIGSLVIGKAGDVIAIDLDCLSTQPVYDAISQIVYAANRQQVVDVWVNGKRVLKKRQLTTIDVMELKAKVVEWQARLAR
jgi:5-methylthioadenosine/S-adenosylhomocysteine deaminase